MGILQARILAWVAMPSSRGSSHPGMQPGPPAFQRDSYQLSHQGSPVWHCLSYLKCSFFFLSMFNLALCVTSFQIYLPSRSQSKLPLSALFGLPSAPCEVRPGTSNPGVRVLGNGLRGQRLQAETPEGQLKAPSWRPPCPARVLCWACPCFLLAAHHSH